MKPHRLTASRWALSLVLAASVVAVHAADYSVFKLRRVNGTTLATWSYLDTTYWQVEPVPEGSLPTPAASNTEDWVFWDVSSVAFSQGFASDDFASQWAAVPAIEAAIDSWDDIDASVLTLSYEEKDGTETNDPGDGENFVFWSDHSSLGPGNALTLITIADTSGAEVGEITDVDIALNDDKLWTLNTARCGTDTLDVQSVVTHELGHALGLGHATGANAMTPSSGPGGWCANSDSLDYENNLAQRDVTTKDEDGDEDIYGNSPSVLSEQGGGSGQKPIARSQGAQTGVAIFPNPFNPEVTVSFQLEQPSRVAVSVYDMLGRRIRTLADESSQSAGQFRQTWDGRDDDGRQAASGSYLLRMEINGVEESRKLTLIR